MTTGVRRRMGVEERRQQLIAVALGLFSERSVAEVSMDDIASAAGISRPLVYHYFPGKHSLYEAAVRHAADQLASRFDEPQTGGFGHRLLRVMGRYFDFVEEQGPGFSALLRGAAAVGAEGTTGVIDDVRSTAYAQILRHLGNPSPGPRLSLVIRSWVGLAETSALIWLTDRAIDREVLELQLVHDFMALAVVAAVSDEETADTVRVILAREPVDGPFHGFAAHLSSLGLSPHP